MDKFRKTVKRLRETFPPAFPIRVKVVKQTKQWEGYFGDTSLKQTKAGNSYFLIRVVDYTNLHPWLGNQVMIDTLTHEWAHAVAWSHRHNSHPELGCHGPEWGVAYAQIFSSNYKTP